MSWWSWPKDIHFSDLFHFLLLRHKKIMSHKFASEIWQFEWKFPVSVEQVTLPVLLGEMLLTVFLNDDPGYKLVSQILENGPASPCWFWPTLPKGLLLGPGAWLSEQVTWIRLCSAPFIFF